MRILLYLRNTHINTSIIITARFGHVFSFFNVSLKFSWRLYRDYIEIYFVFAVRNMSHYHMFI